MLFYQAYIMDEILTGNSPDFARGKQMYLSFVKEEPAFADWRVIAVFVMLKQRATCGNPYKKLVYKSINGTKKFSVMCSE